MASLVGLRFTLNLWTNMIWGYEYWLIIPDSLPLGLEMVYEWVLDGLRDRLGVGSELWTCEQAWFEDMSIGWLFPGLKV